MKIAHRGVSLLILAVGAGLLLSSVEVIPIHAGGSNGGSGGGTSSGSNSNCISCVILPVMSSTLGLLVIGGLLGIIASLALVTIRAQGDLEKTKRRMKQLTR